MKNLIYNSVIMQYTPYRVFRTIIAGWLTWLAGGDGVVLVIAMVDNTR